ncbi:hypothetical protein [Olsenella profusa]|uniref:Translation initiation factor 2 n=1 Tax=Olsenella profusa TaxID=138595 RepID=A0ABS2F1G8_9ACTN|nr:hypothetical protein [Olsenella profusa]MBM6774673.1 hypothetical protein [Olsenella profusa]
MSEDNELENEVTEPEAAPAERTPYVRQRPAHRSVEPIDDFALEEGEPETFAHDSGFTTRGGAFSGRAYRRSRAEGAQLRRDLHYGQYLEIPKGRRDIFASRERKTRIKTALAAIAVLAILAVVVFVLWEYMQTNWGATS